MNDDEIISKLEENIVELESMVKPCAQGILRTTEVHNNLIRIRNSTIKSLPHDSTAYRLYDRYLRENRKWFIDTISGYIHHDNCVYIDEEISMLKELISEIRPELTLTNLITKDEVHFEKGELVKAGNHIYKIMLQTKRSLKIIDPYLDNTIFDFICSLDPTIIFKLITRNPSTIFDHLLRLGKEEGLKIEVRKSDSFHNRYLIIDNNHAWDLGASIKDAGRKDFTIKRFTDEQEIRKLITRFDEEWSKSDPLV